MKRSNGMRILYVIAAAVVVIGLLVGTGITYLAWTQPHKGPESGEYGKATAPSVYNVYIEFVGHKDQRRAIQVTARYCTYYEHYSATGLGCLEPTHAFSNDKSLARLPNERWFRRDGISKTFELPENGKLRVQFYDFVNDSILLATWNVDGESILGPLEAPELDVAMQNRGDWKVESSVVDGIYTGKFVSPSGIGRFVSDLSLDEWGGKAGYGLFTQETDTGFAFNSGTNIPQGGYTLRLMFAIPDRKNGGVPYKYDVSIPQVVTTIVTDTLR